MARLSLTEDVNLKSLLEEVGFTSQQGFAIYEDFAEAKKGGTTRYLIISVNPMEDEVFTLGTYLSRIDVEVVLVYAEVVNGLPGLDTNVESVKGVLREFCLPGTVVSTPSPTITGIPEKRVSITGTYNLERPYA